MGKLEKGLLLIFLILGAVPFAVDDPYLLRVLTSALMLTTLALAHNLLLGYTGYPAFGGVAFFGIGAYASGVLSKDFPFWMSILASAVVPTLVALLVGPVLLRLKSHYFAIATLALQLSFSEMVNNLAFTGGSQGINLQPPFGNIPFYYLFLSLAVLSFLLNLYVDRSVFGYALKAIREDEVAAESLGVNTALFKTVAFLMMASLVGVCGGLYAFWITYIDNTSVFDPLLSVKTFVALLLGGVGTTVGPVVGAFLLEISSEILWVSMPEIHGVLLGSFVVLILLLFPKGIIRSN